MIAKLIYMKKKLLLFHIKLFVLLGEFALLAFGINANGIILSVGSLATLVTVFIVGKVISVENIKKKKEQS